MKVPDQLRTERLVLRPLLPNQEPDFVALLTDPSAVEFMFDSAQKTVLGARGFLREVIASYATDSPYYLLAMVPSDTGELLGLCGISPLPSTDVHELFCCISPRHRRQGHATEALRCLVEHCRIEHGITALCAHINPGNSQSMRLAERCGARCTGVAWHPVSGEPCMVYSLILPV